MQKCSKKKKILRPTVQRELQLLSTLFKKHKVHITAETYRTYLKDKNINISLSNYL